MTQGVPTATVEELRLIEPEPAVAVKVPPVQPLVLAPLGVWTTRPPGNVSEMVTPVRLTVSGLVMVIVSSELTLGSTEVGLKVLVIVGGLLTGRVAVAVKPVPPLVELTLPVVLVATPPVLSVTLAVMVQLLPVGMEAPLMLTVLVPTPPPVNVAPEQLVEAAVEKVIPVGRVSLTATPDSATVLAAGLVMVIVMVEVPPTGMPVAEEPKAFVIVGGATTFRVAVAAVPEPSLEVTAPVLLVLLPAVELVTLTETEQLLPGVLMEPPDRLIEDALALAVKVPLQVLVAFGVEATVIPVGKESVKAMAVIAPVSVAGSVIVMVRVVVAPDAMDGGANALLTVGGAVTVRVAEAVVPVPPLVEVTALVVLR